MKKTHFKNKTFFWAIITYLFSITIWNLYITIAYLNPLGLIPIILQCILLNLIFIRHKMVKIGIKIWAIIFLITSSGLQFVGRLLQDVGSGYVKVDFIHYLTTGVTVLIGISIVVLSNKTVEVKEIGV